MTEYEAASSQPNFTESELPKDGGMIMEHVIRENKRRFTCAHCEYDLEKPMQLICGHRYSAECVIKEAGRLCKSCLHFDTQTIVSMKESFSDNGIAKDMHDFKLLCKRMEALNFKKILEEEKISAFGRADVKIARKQPVSMSKGVVWTVQGVNNLLMKTTNVMTSPVYSESYFTEDGYQFAICLYPSGDGMAKGRYISVFFVLMRGPNDHCLPWPFTKKITITLINQAEHGDIRDSFYPDPTSSSFQRPEGERNVPSGCPLFCPLETLLDQRSGFIKDDCIKIEVEVQNNK